jgi:streptomycin 6-kinase
VPSMAEVCAGWADLLTARALRAGRFADTGLVRTAADLLRSLPEPGAGTSALVHGDLNPGNVLRGPGGRWAAIDPKPMLGDPAYDLWPLLEQVDDPFAHADPEATLRARTELVADRVGLDPRRVAAWGLARGVEAGLWWWDRTGEEDGVRRRLAEAAVWARLLG